MSDADLAALFDDLVEVLGEDYANIAAANGETILPSVYDVCTRKTFCTRQSLTNMLYFVDGERENLTTPPPPYVEPPQPEVPQCTYTKLLCYFINYTVNTCV